MLTYQFKSYINKEQKDKLWRHANKLNFLYNFFLDQRNTDRIKNSFLEKDQRKYITRFDQTKELTILRNTDPSLKEIHSQVLQQSAIRLEKSYKNFLRRCGKKDKSKGFPKFRSCKNFFGICYTQPRANNINLNTNIFKTKEYGEIKFKRTREVLGVIKQISITNKNNAFYINIVTDFVNTNDCVKNSSIAIDVGIKSLYVTNTGKTLKNCTHAKFFDKRIERIQSIADKCKKGSRRNKKFIKVKQRLHGVKNRKINDFQHKASKRLARQCDVIFAENLSVKKMSESDKTSLNKAIRNAKLSQFIGYLQYKANKVVLVNPMNTSKTCNNCGNIYKELKLSERIITCSCCKATYDRDENAAKNIFCLGQAILKSPLRYNLDTTINELFRDIKSQPTAMELEAPSFRTG